MDKNQGNLCNNCKHRFRRIFIPTRPEEYEDAEGNTMTAEEDTIIISNQCLTTSMDIDGEATIECSHFEPVKEKQYEPSIFNYLK